MRLEDRLATVRRAGRLLFRGWGRELAQVMPRSAVSWISGGHALLECGTRQLSLRGSRLPGEPEQPRTWLLPDDQFGAVPWDEIRDMCRDADLTVLLPESAVLRMALRLPKGVPAHANTVRFALLRASPLTLTQSKFVWWAPARREGAVDVAVCRQADLAAWEQLLTRRLHGAVCLAIRPPQSRSDLTEQLRVVGQSRPFRRLWRLRRSILLLLPLLVMCTVWTGAGGMAVWKAEAMRTELESLGMRLQAADAQARRLAALQALNTALLSRADQPPVSELLDKLANALPEDTFLTDLKWEDGRLRLAGRTGDMSRLASPWPGDPRWTDVRLESLQAVGNAGNAGSVFEISMVAVRPR